MKAQLPQWIPATLAAACLASVVGCYPAYPAPNYASYQDSKGYQVPPESAPVQQPRYVVDPAVAIAGVAAAGLLGYAIGNHHHHDYYHGPVYYGPRYYRPVPYGGYYRPRYYH